MFEIVELVINCILMVAIISLCWIHLNEIIDPRECERYGYSLIIAGSFAKFSDYGVQLWAHYNHPETTATILIFTANIVESTHPQTLTNIGMVLIGLSLSDKLTTIITNVTGKFHIRTIKKT